MHWHGHAAVAYLAFALVRRITGHDVDEAGVIPALVLGAVFPDLVDKSLAWGLGVLPGSRTVAHSAFTAVVVAILAYWVGARLDRASAGLAFAVGCVTHVIGDVYRTVLAGGTTGLLFWPFDPVQIWGGSVSLPGPRTVEWVLLGLAVVAWAADDFPGRSLSRPAKAVVLGVVLFGVVLALTGSSGHPRTWF